MKRQTFLQIIFAALLLTTLTTPSFAHKVRIFAWEEGGNIVTESKFSGGRAANNATVSVIDADTGRELLSGTTDPEGMFSFPLPSSGVKNLDIIVNGGDGHKNHWQYVIEYSGGSVASPPGIAVQPENKQPYPEKTVDKVTDDTLATVTMEELNHLLETTIDKKLVPIRRTLAENAEKGPTLQDILGGIGYIIGLAGIAAYVQSLNKKKE
ncbi:MAG: hypothetical protein WBB19_08865 [Desulforhopalus sp.]